MGDDDSAGGRVIVVVLRLQSSSQVKKRQLRALCFSKTRRYKSPLGGSALHENTHRLTVCRWHEACHVGGH